MIETSNAVKATSSVWVAAQRLSSQLQLSMQTLQVRFCLQHRVRLCSQRSRHHPFRTLGKGLPLVCEEGAGKLQQPARQAVAGQHLGELSMVGSWCCACAGAVSVNGRVLQDRPGLGSDSLSLHPSWPNGVVLLRPKWRCRSDLCVIRCMAITDSGFFRRFGAAGSSLAGPSAKCCWHHRGLKPRLVPPPPAADPGSP